MSLEKLCISPWIYHRRVLGKLGGEKLAPRLVEIKEIYQN